MKKTNLMILGASGGVANAFLHYFPAYRNFINKLVLLDKNKKVLDDPYIDHKFLRYKFIHHKIKLPQKEKELSQILKENSIDIVIDLTDYETIPLMKVVNNANASYINTALNSDKDIVSDIFFKIMQMGKNLNTKPHILCSGMNPGCVNMFVEYGIKKYGIPEEIIHFEYDTSQEATEWHPMMTWSIHEFLVEAVRDPSGVMLGKNKIKLLFPNALKHRVSMKKILSPVWHLPEYPRGLTVLHEENVSISNKYNIPSKFIYAINIKTMDYLEKIYNKKHNVLKKDLKLGDNVKKVLEGSDNTGVLLNYKNKKIYYMNRMPNFAFMGTNATYAQVIIGIFAAFLTLISDSLPSRIYFVEDLYDSHYKYYLFDNMRVQEYVFKKVKNRLKLEKYTPEIKLHYKNHIKHEHLI